MSWRFLIAILASMTWLAGCDTGASYSDRSQGTASIKIGASEFDGDSSSPATEVPVDEAIQIEFSRFLVVSTIKASNVFLVATESLDSDEGSVSFDGVICQESAALDAFVSYDNKTITIAPQAELTCGLTYAICLTPNLMFDEDLNYDGRTIFFETQACD